MGVDVSEKMLEEANAAYNSDSHMEFRQRNCTKSEVYTSRDGTKGGFDLVFAGCLLKYATIPEEMLKMWETVFINMRPGARVLTFVPNPDIDSERGWGDNNSGLSLIPLEKLLFGWRSRCIVHTDPEFSFETCQFKAEVYEDFAKKAGMKDFRWIDAILPEDERKVNGFLDELERQGPIFKVIETWC